MKHFVRMIFVSSLALAAVGCSTKEFSSKEFSSTPFYTGDEVKFTGAVEDRVNLWPVAYWREPVGSVAWPLVSWGDGHFAFRPLYSQYGKEHNVLWPIAQFDTGNNDHRVFPFFWGRSYDKDPYLCLFPALWWNHKFAGVFPFFWSRDGGGGGFCVFPLVWAEWTASGSGWNTIWPLYYYESFPKSDKHYPSDQSEFWAICYLAGWNRRSGEWRDHRLLPFYVWDQGDFYSLPYSRYEENGMAKTRIFAGLAGCNTATNGGYAASWVFPFYYHDANKLVTPLFGMSGDAMWMFPLWYCDEDSFVTPLYGRSGDADWIFPLFYRDKDSFVTPLYGKVGEGEWFIPFYIRDDVSFWSIPYSWEAAAYNGGTTTNKYFMAGLAGFRSGGTEGGWVFPIFDTKKHADYDEKAAWIDAEELPTAKPFHASDCRTYFLLSDDDRDVRGRKHDKWNRVATNRYEIAASRKVGNYLFVNRKEARRVLFDTDTRRKVSDKEDDAFSFLVFLYNYTRKADRMEGTTYTRHNVLWKLWDWTEKDGNVSLDVFPGFTYDSKLDGYRKTSFLWRFFRYESDPETDATAVDFLFIPVWR